MGWSMDEQEGPDIESLTEFLYLCPVALVEFDNDGAISMMNAKGAQIFMQLAKRPDIDNLFEVLKGYLPQLPDLIGDSPRKGVVCENLRVEAGRLSRRSKRDLVVFISVVRVNEDRLFATAQDVSWSAEQEKAARRAEERLRLIMDGARDVAIVPLDPDGTVRFWNASAERLFGFPNGAALGARIQDIATPDLQTDEDLNLDEMLQTALSGQVAECEGWARRHARTTFWAEMTMSRVDGPDGIEGITLVARDATRRHRERTVLLQRAQFDHLTKLPNRGHFEELAQLELSRWRASGVPFCIGLLDVDHFKKVNDTWGHPAGDEVLRAIARTCKQGVRDVDVVGRHGGEEFILLFAGTDLDGAVIAAERIRAAVEELATAVDGVEIRVTASLGIAQVESGLTALDRITARADHALYQAKSQGRNRVRLFESGAESDTLQTA